MKLFLMRHGEAELAARNDSQRCLTDSGCEDVRQMAERHRQELAAVDALWVSPYVRAQQTADIVSDVLGTLNSRETQPLLKPSSDPNAVFKALEGKEQTLLLVTHQPLVGTLVDLLAGLEPGSHRLGTAALACIEADVMARGCGELCWLHQPTFN